MKAGDLVKCIWQPSTKIVVNGACVPMDICIKGQYGLLLKSRANDYTHPYPCIWYIYFAKYSYIHPLDLSAFEVLE
jgi:hypothetical protein